MSSQDLINQYPIQIKIGNSQMIANLTKDEASKMFNELGHKIVNYTKSKPQSIIDKVKTWKDALDIQGKKTKLHVVIGKELVSSEARTKSVLAYCRLSLIADVLNEGWIIDWTDSDQNKYTAIYDYTQNLLDVDYWSIVQCSTIYLKSEELAQYMITQFSQLWYDYFMITKS